MDNFDAAVRNVPEYTVSELSAAVKRALEGSFGRVRVRGEVTELKCYPSGHTYLSLKDEGGKISAVIWKSAVSRLGTKPETGVEIIATGWLTAYAERSTYQLIVERLEYAGIGALLARIDMLRQRLAAEGLFDAARKRAIPILPSVIGIITSELGSVLQDIRITIDRRFKRRIFVWPVPVQGETAAARIATVIASFDALLPDGSIPRPDVLIVARGGGSLQDLMAFNDEAVVRAVASCRIPLISGVGHETDTTLVDFAADRRAPTPTAAAEMAVPLRAEMLDRLEHLRVRLLGCVNHRRAERRLALERAASLLPSLPAFIGLTRQRLDFRSERLVIAISRSIATRRAAVVRAAQRLPNPKLFPKLARAHVCNFAARLPAILPYQLERRRGALQLCAQKLLNGSRHSHAGMAVSAARTLTRLSVASLEALMRACRARAQGVGRHLEAVSPLAVLSRGYILVFDDFGSLLTEGRQVLSDQRLRLRFCDGEILAVANRSGSDLQRKTQVNVT